MIPHSVKAPTIPIPFHRLLKVVAIVDRDERADEGTARPDPRGELRGRGDAIASTATCTKTRRSAHTSRASTAIGAKTRRRLAGEVRALGFDTPLWALADSHQISDLAVVGGLGEVDGYIYLGQQTPAFYAKQVIASLVKYGLGLLPPFFGGLMAYDCERDDRVRLSRSSGRTVLQEIAGRPAVLQALRRGHLPQRPVQRRRRSRRSADSRRGGRRGAETRGARVRRRSHVLRAERHQHVEQGRNRFGAEARRPGAVRSQQSQVAAPGCARSGRRDADLPADRAQPVRHDRRGRLGRVGREIRCASRSATIRSSRTNRARTRERPFRLACIQLATYDGTVYNVKKVLERIGHLCDYVLWDEAWIGYNAFHPLFDDHSPMRLTDLVARFARTLLDAIGAQATRRVSRRRRRSTSATNTSAGSAATSNTSASTKRS